MAALLERNDVKREATAGAEFSAGQNVPCFGKSCKISYTLFYTQTENRMEDGQNVLDLIRRTAFQLVTARHPHERGDDTYIWGGPGLGWMDKEEARAAGL